MDFEVVGGELRQATKSITPREAIFEAARKAFAIEGYDGASIRGIAKDAGVAVGLVNKCFGSKAALFEDVLTNRFRPLEHLPENRDDFGIWLAENLIRRDATPDSLDPFLTILRSAGDETAIPIIRAVAERCLIDPIVSWLGEDDARQRAVVIVSLLVGTGLLRNVVGVRELREADVEVVIKVLARMFQRALDTPLPRTSGEASG